MSFRELRNFCEIMRSLGYPRLVSMENFRQPNFELVADLLDWLLHRFEPNVSLSDDITSEARRVEFITAACQRILSCNGLKLNPKKLYGADGYAVKELLRLATMLYDAQRSVVSDTSAGKDSGEDSFGLSSRLADLKGTRTLCSEIVETGAGLFDLFEKEKETRPDRERALRFLDGMSRNLDSNSEHDVVERSLQQLLGCNSGNLEQLKSMSEELQRDERNLEQKIKKKRQELERCKKRLYSLANVRPAFMDEYDQLEQGLERYYEQYVGRFRNLDYLEHEIDSLNREETERMEENERALKRLQKRLLEAEWRLLRGEDDEKDAKKPVSHRKGWAPPSGNEETCDEDYVSSAASGSDDDSERISLAGDAASSQESGDEALCVAKPQAGDPNMSIGGSVSDDDIMNESDDEEELSDDGLRGGRGKLSSNFDSSF